MRGVELPQEDYFAPRPKLSQCVRMIRIAAIVMATWISVNVFILHVLLFNRFMPGAATTNIAVYLSIATFIQLLLLLHCWRAWLLKRWAYFIMLFDFLLFPFWAGA